MLENHKDLIKKISEIAEIDSSIVDDNFIIDDSNLDPISILTLMASTYQIYQLKITFEQISSSKNIAGLINFIEKKSR